MQSKMNRAIYLMLGCSAGLALTTELLRDKAYAQVTPEAVTTEQVIAAIRTAVAASPGNVREVEVEEEDGKAIVEVEVLAADGSTREVVVDITTNTVIPD